MKRRGGSWEAIVLGGHVILVLLVLPLSVQGQAIADPVVFQLEEEQEPTAYVGNVAMQSGLTSLLTEEQFKRLQFDIHDSDLFAVDSSSGDLSTKQTIDREAVCPSQKQCELKFEIAVYEQDDSGDFDLYTVLNCVVQITDLNDNPPTFPQESVTLTIPEGNEPGEVLRTSAAVDLDMTDKNSIQQYRFKNPSDLFTLLVIKNPDRSSYLGIRVKEELNREVRDFYQVTVVAEDGGNSIRSGTVLINITVTDDNDNEPQFVKSSYNESVKENFDLHVPIMRVEATDKDTGMNAEISYRFSSQVADYVRDVLYVHEQTGEILAHDKIDYEEIKIFKFVVEAIDHGEPPSKSRVGVTLHVLDENDNAPQININPSSGGTRISESEQVGKFIAHVSVLDKDEGINGIVICKMVDMNFALEKFNDLTSNMYKIVLDKQLDHEQEATHKISISCTDSGYPPQTNTSSLTIEVLDENDNSPVFTEPKYYGDIMENKNGEHQIAVVEAHDWDSGNFGTVSYSIENKFNGLFVIDSTTGIISVRGPLDRESKATYTFQVFARDGSPERLSSSALVIVTVNDENDEPPRFPKYVYYGEVMENMDIESVVGNVSAVDPDGPANSKFVYSIIRDGSKDSASFSIDPVSGTIKTKTVFDREENPQYSFVVQVSDPAIPSFSSRCNYTVQILDDNDHAPVIHRYKGENTTYVIQSNSPVGSPVTTILAFDGDSVTSPNSQLIFLIDSGDDLQLFNLNRYTGSLTLARILQPSDPKTYDLVIRVEDGGQPPLFDTKEYTIVMNGTAAARASSGGLSQNILIVIILLGVTIVLGLAVVAAICLIRKIDRERRANREAKKKMDEKMYHMKQDDDVFNGDSLSQPALDTTDDSNSTSNNLNKRAKKEVSFSFDEESDSHNTSTGSGHPLTSFRVGTDRNKHNGVSTDHLCNYVCVCVCARTHVCTQKGECKRMSF